jgi:YfiH family protein
MTGDDPERVDENRRRVCAAVDVDANRLVVNRQIHSPTVNRAHPGSRGEPGDGLWTDEAEIPMLALTADCVPVAIVGGGRLAVLHAGWRGLVEGVVEAGIGALGRRAAAVIGPAIGPCCYEVGRDVAERFDRDLLRDRRLDIWTATERRLRAAGVASVERVDLCTACNPNLFFSHRRDGKPRGVQGVVGVLV